MSGLGLRFPPQKNIHYHSVNATHTKPEVTGNNMSKTTFNNYETTKNKNMECLNNVEKRERNLKSQL